MAERLGTGLQNLLARFNSGPDLHIRLARPNADATGTVLLKAKVTARTVGLSFAVMRFARKLLEAGNRGRMAAPGSPPDQPFLQSLSRCR